MTEGPSAEESAPVGEGGERTLAEKLDYLFRTVHPAGRGEYSYDEVSSAIAERGGPTISASYVWQLRKGQRDNPTHRHIAALSQFFGVPPAYFFDSELAAKVDRELEVITAMRDAGVIQVAFRSSGLPVDALEAVGGLIEYLRSAHGLDKKEPGDEPGGDPKP